MGVTAVLVFSAIGALAGATASVGALREDRSRPRWVALWSAATLALAGFMILHRVFWSSLEYRPIQDVLMPDFLSPGRAEKILLWYAVGSGGIAGLVTAAFHRMVRRGPQA